MSSSKGHIVVTGPGRVIPEFKHVGQALRLGQASACIAPAASLLHRTVTECERESSSTAARAGEWFLLRSAGSAAQRRDALAASVSDRYLHYLAATATCCWSPHHYTLQQPVQAERAASLH
jgi:hypothetical protein